MLEGNGAGSISMLSNIKLLGTDARLEFERVRRIDITRALRLKLKIMATAQRWKGVLNLSSSSSHGFRVLASLACTSSGSLVEPASNVIFFVGDRVRESANPIVERLSQLENIAAALLPKLGQQPVNLWIMEASVYKGPFACYENILPSLTASGEPIGYKPKGLPAARACFSILQDCLTQVKAAQLREKHKDGKVAELQGKENGSSDECVRKTSPFEPFRDLVNKCPPMILLGFSKGGVILNQMLAEIVHYEESLNSHDDHRLKIFSLQDTVSRKGGSEEEKKRQLLPSTVEAFLSSIEEVHYVDVGLNCQGAYQTDPRVLEGLAKAARSRGGGFYVGIHGTPRQWQDSNRRWVAMEKNRCVQLLKEAARKYGGGKLQVNERLYFSERPPDLQMHFEIIDHLVLR